MKLKALVLFAIALLTLGPARVSAQSENKQNYLYEIGIADSLFSEILDEQRNIWIKLPEYYNPDGKKKYPVVYVLDGEVQMKALATVCSYYEGHFLPDMILVGISNQTNRTRDLTTSKVTRRHGWEVKEETGGAEKFTRFIEEELIPFIDSKLPSTTYRTLIGHSYAGLFTINTLINHPHLFANYIAIDPSLDWDDQELLEQAKSKLRGEDFTDKSLYVSLAAVSLHMQNGSISMENIMKDTSEHSLFARSIIEFSEFAENQKQSGLNFSWQHYPDDLHGTVSLPSIRDGLISQFEWYQLESFWKYNNPDTPTEELVELVKNREQKLSTHFAYPSIPLEEELFSMMGYMSMQFGQFEKAIAFFKLGIEYYPESATAYDSMADYYESQEDIPNALKYVTTAFEISGEDYHKKRMEEFRKAVIILQ